MKNNMKRDFISLDQLIGQAGSIGLGGHIHPDGDCVGSTLAVYNYIRDYFPQVEVKLYLESIPEKFAFLQRADEIITEFPEAEPVELFIALDCSDAARLGEGEKYFRQAKRTACIDHHISNEIFANVSFVDPQASSASELVCELIGRERINHKLAECLYLGIVHDTGVFQYSCTSARTMEIAGWLMEKGIDYPAIVDHTFYTRTEVESRMLGLSLLKSERFLNGKVMVSVITLEDMKRYQATNRDLGVIVSQLRIIDGVEVALFLYENEDGGFKGSLRVNTDLDVAKVASAFGGGGHVKAAGFSIDGPYETALERILKEIAKQL